MSIEMKRMKKKRKVDDEGQFVVVTDRFKEGRGKSNNDGIHKNQVKRRSVKVSKEDACPKSSLSGTRSEGDVSNGVQVVDMDLHNTSNMKEASKEGNKIMEFGSIHEDSVLGLGNSIRMDELKSIRAKIGVVWEGSKNNEQIVEEEESVTGFQQ
ncbi:hypothetical protein Tco_0425753 [Tanacetum coccineum]